MYKDSVTRFIEFQDIFDEDMLDAESYLVNLPYKKGAFLLLANWLHNSHQPYLNFTSLKYGGGHLNFLEQIAIASENPKMMGNIKSLRADGMANNIKYVWISPYTCLTFLEHLVTNYYQEIFVEGVLNIEEAEKQIEKIQYSKEALVFVKAFIAFSHIRIDRLLSHKSNDYDSLTLNQVTDRIGTYEYEGFEYPYIYGIEVLKSIEFFSFLSDSYKNVLAQFLESRNLVNWEEYVLKMSGIMERFLEGKQRVRVESGIEKEVDIALLKRFVTSDIFLHEQANFLNLKKNPLIKYADNGFLSIFQIFVFEKIYKALYFDITLVANELGVSLGKNELGKEFFEEWLCTKYVNKIFKGPKIINIQETDEAFKKLTEIPDHYIRNWDDVYVFEYKDTLIADKAKVSLDSEEVLRELKEKLYQKIANRKKPKKSAVLQLAEFIINYEKNHIHFDPKASPNKVTFYPILVVQDRCLSTPGINQILNELFIETMKNSGSKVKYKSLVIINIDTFLLARGILDNIKDLKECLNDYIRVANDVKNKKSRILMSFESWFKRIYIYKKGKQKEASYYLFHEVNMALNELRIAVYRN
ncbi:hypothetical protein D770_24705 [Flammeovirgaceae bacterium 311]|nr:hypothetical protein D770_24705 [Flammeovirgaceae bacterium 311]